MKTNLFSILAVFLVLFSACKPTPEEVLDHNQAILAVLEQGEDYICCYSKGDEVYFINEEDSILPFKVVGKAMTTSIIPIEYGNPNDETGGFIDFMNGAGLILNIYHQTINLYVHIGWEWEDDYGWLVAFDMYSSLQDRCKNSTYSEEPMEFASDDIIIENHCGRWCHLRKFQGIMEMFDGEYTWYPCDKNGVRLYKE